MLPFLIAVTLLASSPSAPTSDRWELVFEDDLDHVVVHHELWHVLGDEERTDAQEAANASSKPEHGDSE